MADRFHGELVTIDGVHAPISFVYATKLEMDSAAVFVSSDLLKFSYVQATKTIYQLVGLSPLEWKRIGVTDAGDLPFTSSSGLDSVTTGEAIDEVNTKVDDLDAESVNFGPVEGFNARNTRDAIIEAAEPADLSELNEETRQLGQRQERSFFFLKDFKTPDKDWDVGRGNLELLMHPIAQANINNTFGHTIAPNTLPFNQGFSGSRFTQGGSSRAYYIPYLKLPIGDELTNLYRLRFHRANGEDWPHVNFNEFTLVQTDATHRFYELENRNDEGVVSLEPGDFIDFEVIEGIADDSDKRSIYGGQVEGRISSRSLRTSIENATSGDIDSIKTTLGVTGQPGNGGDGGDVPAASVSFDSEDIETIDADTVQEAIPEVNTKLRGLIDAIEVPEIPEIPEDPEEVQNFHKIIREQDRNVDLGLASDNGLADGGVVLSKTGTIATHDLVLQYAFAPVMETAQYVGGETDNLEFRGKINQAVLYVAIPDAFISSVEGGAGNIFIHVLDASTGFADSDHRWQLSSQFSRLEDRIVPNVGNIACFVYNPLQINDEVKRFNYVGYSRVQIRVRGVDRHFTLDPTKYTPPEISNSSISEEKLAPSVAAKLNLQPGLPAEDEAKIDAVITKTESVEAPPDTPLWYKTGEIHLSSDGSIPSIPENLSEYEETVFENGLLRYGTTVNLVLLVRSHIRITRVDHLVDLTFHALKIIDGETYRIYTGRLAAGTEVNPLNNISSAHGEVDTITPVSLVNTIEIGEANAGKFVDGELTVLRDQLEGEIEESERRTTLPDALKALIVGSKIEYYDDAYNRARNSFSIPSTAFMFLNGFPSTNEDYPISSLLTNEIRNSVIQGLVSSPGSVYFPREIPDGMLHTTFFNTGLVQDLSLFRNKTFEDLNTSGDLDLIEGSFAGFAYDITITPETESIIDEISTYIVLRDGPLTEGEAVCVIYEADSDTVLQESERVVLSTLNEGVNEVKFKFSNFNLDRREEGYSIAIIIRDHRIGVGDESSGIGLLVPKYNNPDTLTTTRSVIRVQSGSDFTEEITPIPESPFNRTIFISIEGTEGNERQAIYSGIDVIADNSLTGRGLVSGFIQLSGFDNTNPNLLVGGWFINNSLRNSTSFSNANNFISLWKGRDSSGNDLGYENIISVTANRVFIKELVTPGTTEDVTVKRFAPFWPDYDREATFQPGRDIDALIEHEAIIEAAGTYTVEWNWIANGLTHPVRNFDYTINNLNSYQGPRDFTLSWDYYFDQLTGAIYDNVAAVRAAGKTLDDSEIIFISYRQVVSVQYSGDGSTGAVRTPHRLTFLVRHFTHNSGYTGARIDSAKVRVFREVTRTYQVDPVFDDNAHAINLPNEKIAKFLVRFKEAANGNVCVIGAIENYEGDNNTLQTTTFTQDLGVAKEQFDYSMLRVFANGTFHQLTRGIQYNEESTEGDLPDSASLVSKVMVDDSKELADSIFGEFFHRREHIPYSRFRQETIFDRLNIIDSEGNLFQLSVDSDQLGLIKNGSVLPPAERNAASTPFTPPQGSNLQARNVNSALVEVEGLIGNVTRWQSFTIEDSAQGTVISLDDLSFSSAENAVSEFEFVISRGTDIRSVGVFELVKRNSTDWDLGKVSYSQEHFLAFGSTVSSGEVTATLTHDADSRGAGKIIIRRRLIPDV